MKKLSQIYDKEETQKFVVPFLIDDEDLSVHRRELDEINFSSAIEHVKWEAPFSSHEEGSFTQIRNSLNR